MGRIVGIDYGNKRVGVAVTDSLGIIATPLSTVHSKEIIAFLKEYIGKETVDCFVVGLPRRMNYKLSDLEKQITGFIRILKKNFQGIPVERMDERFTSRMAMQTMIDSGFKKKDRQNKEFVDTISATLILQSYLERSKVI